ncbi:MAG TPA: glycosyltransferase family 1 protein [Deltaproteobacteria bacterium]|nr:glycosyltransferase family 1 protein [Deltaproteobacteria bacterium]
MFNTPARKIIFNQNTYNTFGTYSLGDPDPGGIYLDSGVVAAMVVSEDNRQYLQYAYDKIPIYRIHNSINPDLFFSGGRKKTQIAFMPRKNSDHALQVVALLRVRGVLDDFDVVPIENRTERETASILRESLIFLSFGYPEGISLPPAEAMACGSIVIGYHGMGGREYFRPEYCYPVEMGDILSFAKTVEDVVEIYKKEPRVIEEKRLKASAFIREEYSQDREKSDVLNAWSEIIRRCERKHSLHESHEKGF